MININEILRSNRKYFKSESIIYILFYKMYKSGIHMRMKKLSTQNNLSMKFLFKYTLLGKSIFFIRKVILPENNVPSSSFYP